MSSAKNFFTEAEKQEIITAIKHAEAASSGEIKVHLDETCKGDVFNHAIFVFHKLNMQKTNLRNAVLFYLAVDDKKFAIIADEGINNAVPALFWDDIKAGMQEEFMKGRFLQGLLQGIELTGEKLKYYFPVAIEDVNELGDEISFGNE
jgi:uncharacterized membrane protein